MGFDEQIRQYKEARKAAIQCAISDLKRIAKSLEGKQAGLAEDIVTKAADKLYDAYANEIGHEY